MEQPKRNAKPPGITVHQPGRTQTLIMKNKAVLLHVILAIGSCLAVSAQGHGHLNVGAEARDQDSRLIFENGADFATDSAYVKTLNFATDGKYADFYEGNITLTALHSTNAFGEIEEDSPAPGSFIVAEIVSVKGPSGGTFGFWDVDSTTAPTHSIPAGTTNGAFRFDLSSADLGAGQPGGDPFGHIHGRRFTATKPGLYTVGFRALDTSRNGSANGPIHTSSTVLHVYFQAGVKFSVLT